MALNIYDEYERLLAEGNVQKAYRGIIQFMLKCQSNLKTICPDFEVSGIYQGYMDMSYFSFTPKSLSEQGLKIAIVFLHESFAFQVWLSARNRLLQDKYRVLLTQAGWNPSEISAPGPGVDSIIENSLVKRPDFEDPDRLIDQILQGAVEFSAKIDALLSNKVSL